MMIAGSALLAGYFKVLGCAEREKAAASEKVIDIAKTNVYN